MDFRADISDAAQSGNLDRLRDLVRGSRDMANLPDEGGYTPLHYAAYFGHADVARFLIETGAEVSVTSMDPLRNTPLHAAAGSGHAEVAEVLLDGGADPNALQTGDWTPLHAAAQKGHEAIVRLLLARGADPHRTSASGATPRALAVEKAHHSVVALLPGGTA